MTSVNYDTLCLSGGGVKGFAFLGALKYLQSIKHIDLSNITNYVGTSAGSMVSFVLSLDYTPHDIINFILEFNFKKIVPESSIDTLLLSHGIDNGDKIMIIMQNFLKEKFNLDDITFEEHYKLTNKKITFIGTNFTKGTETPFNYITHPNMSVLTAIRISISIPIVFTPVLYDSDYYVDGALVNNFPIKYCNPETTLGMYIKNCISNKLDNIMNLTVGCLSIVTDIISKKDCRDCYYIVEIENCNMEATNFDIDNERKLKIINLGIKFAKKFIEKFSIIKIKTDCATQTDLIETNESK
jgi:NTE family protein